LARPRTCNLALGLLGCAVAVAASSSAIAADIDPFDGQWHGAITPYGWFPAFTTDIRFVARGGTEIAPSVEVKPSNYLSDLQFAGMLNANARKGNLFLFGDLVYADLASLKSKVKTLSGPDGVIQLPVNADLNVRLTTTIVTAGVGLNVWRAPSGFLDVFGGVQYGNIRSSVDANVYGLGGAINRSDASSNTTNLWDGIVGVTGNLNLSDDRKWYVPFEAHIGAGNSNWTWNGILGLGYHFDWGALVVAWRHLTYDATGDSTLQKLQMSGPAIGATFRW
jgi:hypothetical protein